MGIGEKVIARPGAPVIDPGEPVPDRTERPLLEARGLTKSFGPVIALRDADFTVYPSEIVGLIGDNGAGKSTLIKALSGVQRPEVGEIRLEGEPVALTSPAAAARHGIETVYQDLALAPDLDAAANLYLGREIRRPGALGRLGFLDNGAMRRESERTFKRLGVGIPDPTTPVASLSGGQRQGVAVGRAVTWARKVVLMDEPTAALGVVQTEKVLDLMRRVRSEGVSVVFISHNLPEVLEVADRVEVLRLGKRVATFSARNTSVERLVAAMTGAASSHRRQG